MKQMESCVQNDCLLSCFSTQLGTMSMTKLKLCVTLKFPFELITASGADFSSCLLN